MRANQAAGDRRPARQAPAAIGRGSIGSDVAVRAWRFGLGRYLLVAPATPITTAVPTITTAAVAAAITPAAITPILAPAGIGAVIRSAMRGHPTAPPPAPMTRYRMGPPAAAAPHLDDVG